MITETTARAIAHLVSTVKPAWLYASLVSLLGRRAQDADPAVVAVSLLLAAQDPETRSPGRALDTRSPSWRQATELLGAAAAARRPSRPPRAGEACPRHPARFADDCPDCAVDEAQRARQTREVAACRHENASAMEYTPRGLRGRQNGTQRVTAWHCPDCDLLTDTDPR